MKHLAILIALSLGSFVHADEKILFNGKDLTGWKGLPAFWSVKDGAITGQTTAANPVKENTFLIWDGEVGDFELHFKYKITDGDGKAEKGGNSGVQYRSKIVKPEYFVMSGYQADFEVGKTYSGILYEEKGRGILAKRGEKVVHQRGRGGRTSRRSKSPARSGNPRKSKPPSTRPSGMITSSSPRAATSSISSMASKRSMSPTRPPSARRRDFSGFNSTPVRR